VRGFIAMLPLTLRCMNVNHLLANYDRNVMAELTLTPDPNDGPPVVTEFKLSETTPL
jgi:hypothetical protein